VQALGLGTSSFLLEGAPPARQRVLNTRGGPGDRGDRHFRLPLATTQPVKRLL
jgi:hypothetical protein